jgi:hypothetical protein
MLILMELHSLSEEVNLKVRLISTLMASSTPMAAISLATPVSTLVGLKTGLMGSNFYSQIHLV